MCRSSRAVTSKARSRAARCRRPATVVADAQMVAHSSSRAAGGGTGGSDHPRE